jgi:hypothetical protein
MKENKLDHVQLFPPQLIVSHRNWCGNNRAWCATISNEDHMKKDLNLKPYHPNFTNDLSNIDLNRRCDACRALLDTFLSTVSVPYSIQDIIVVFWANEDPNFMVGLEHNLTHVMFWAGMTGTHLIGPYFFNRLVYATSYTEMLDAWLIPQLRDRGLMEDVCLQHLHILLSLCLTFLMNVIWVAGLGMLYQHLPHCYPGHHIVLILPHWTTPSGALARDKWLCIAVITVMTGTKLWNSQSPPLCHKCCGTCYTEHGGASCCVSNTMEHIQIHLIYNHCHHTVC